MAFGRLDVYWPDGPIEIYQLEKPAIGIGRQRGNDIIVDTEAISRYHATLNFREGECYVEDLGSVNGTYVDGVRLEPHTPCQLRGGEELQVGDMRAIYHPVAESSATTSAAVTQVLEVAQPTFRVTLEGTEQTVSPGMHVRSQLIIENLGNSADHYFVELDGIPKGWVRIEQNEVLVAAGARRVLMINVKPPRRAGSSVGSYALNIHVRASSRPAQTVSAKIDLYVRTFNAFGVRLSPKPVELDVPFPVYLHNQGNITLQVSLRGKDDDGALDFNFQPQVFTLQPGQRVSAQVQVSMDPDLRSAGEGVRPFTVVVTSHDAAGWQAGLPGKLIVPPAPPRRSIAPIAAVAIMLLALIPLLIYYTMLRPLSPEVVLAPVIDGPTHAPRAGEKLALSWEAKHASELLLQVVRNGQLQDAIPFGSDVRQYTYTLTEAGQYQFVLIARAGSKEDTGELLLAVLPDITHFDVDPDKLLVGFEEDLTIWWETEGATSVTIAGLADLLCEPITQAFAPQGPQSFRVCPRGLDEGPVKLYVVAQGEGVPDQTGESLSVTISVERAACHLMADEAALYLPSRDSAALMRLGADTLVYVEARDPSDTWMLATTQDGLTGWLWRDEALDCGGIDLSRLIVNDEIATPASLPTPSLTPTLTPSPAPTAAATATTTPPGD